MQVVQNPLYPQSTSGWNRKDRPCPSHHFVYASEFCPPFGGLILNLECGYIYRWGICCKRFWLINFLFHVSLYFSASYDSNGSVPTTDISFETQATQESMYPPVPHSQAPQKPVDDPFISPASHQVLISTYEITTYLVYG